MKKRLLILALTVGLLSSCSPTLTPLVTKRKAPLPSNAPVIELPLSVEIESGYSKLGVVVIKRVDFTNYQDSVLTMDKIKDTARRMGGNAILLTDTKKDATILSLSDSLLYESDPPLIGMMNEERKRMEDNNLISEQLVKPRLLPSFILAANIGYGIRTPKIDKSLTGSDRQVAEDTKKGMAWDASAKYYFNDSYGIGALFSRFAASSDALTPIKTTSNITFVGPAFLMRGAFAQNTWIFEGGFGLGYIGYDLSAKYSGQYEKYTGASVGMIVDLGLEHKFHENFGIAFNLTSVYGALSEITKNENGYKETFTFDDDNLEGLQNIRLSIGLRYYIK